MIFCGAGLPTGVIGEMAFGRAASGGLRGGLRHGGREAHRPMGLGRGSGPHPGGGPLAMAIGYSVVVG